MSILPAAALPLILVTLPLHAAEAPIDAGGGVIQMLLALALIIGLLLGATHLLRRIGIRPTGNASLLKVLAATAVGPRERVVLLAVADKMLVLGVTPGRITQLATLDALPAPEAGSDEKIPPRDFQSWLKQTLERRS